MPLKLMLAKDDMLHVRPVDADDDTQDIVIKVLSIGRRMQLAISAPQYDISHLKVEFDEPALVFDPPSWYKP